MRSSLQTWARQLKAQLLALYFAYQDPRTPWYARVFALGVVAYAFSPIDLIPDMIPLLGYVDDLILLPIGIYFALRLIPAAVMVDARARASNWDQQMPVSRAGATIVILLWLALLAGFAAWVWQRWFAGPR